MKRRTPSAPVFVHPQAIVESRRVGKGTRVWAFAHVQEHAVVGADCNLGEHCFVENGAVVGDRVTVKNGVFLWEGMRVADDVFIGPNATFTNDRHPRSPRSRAGKLRYANRQWVAPVILESGCSVGANATVIGPVRLGRRCMVAAGAVVTRDVEAGALVAGNPARLVGRVNARGERQAPRRAGGRRRA
ncbi:MAG: N-acetyltransferase [Verrucomicrobiae bacterium]|nr:N-acetyltransferase [Verrucomicrobiae bacterium]